MLTIATTADYPPFSMRQPTVMDKDHISGFDVELIRLFAAQIYETVQVVIIRWEELNGLISKPDQVQAIAAGLTITSERSKLGFFSAPLLSNETLLIRFQGTPEKIKKIAVNKGGYLESTGRSLFEENQILGVDDNRLIDALHSGVVSHVLTDALEWSHLQAQSKTALVKQSSLCAQHHGILFFSEELRDGFNKILETFRVDGRLRKLASQFDVEVRLC